MFKRRYIIEMCTYQLRILKEMQESKKKSTISQYFNTSPLGRLSIKDSQTF